MIGPSRDEAAYPFARLDAAKQNLIAQGVDVIDLGMGDPQEDTPAFIRQALIDGITERSSYPRASGLPELRSAVASWLHRRFDVQVDEASIVPTLGSKEVIHSLPAYCAKPGKRLVAVPSPAYPVYDRGARFHGFEVLELPLLAGNAFLPDLDAVPAETWDEVALLWLNYPNNPTGVTAPIELYEVAAEFARRHDFVVASDEAYSEIYTEEPPVSILQLDDLNNVLCVNTLSKRSCVTGYRSGFLAGDPAFIAGLVKYRPSVGVTPQDFVQRASVAAWSDEQHVDDFRALWAAKRDVVMPVLEDNGLTVHGDATFFLWVDVPDGKTSESFAEELLGHGLVVTPGSFFGSAGEGYVRLALVPPIDRCKQAAMRLSTIL